MHRCQISGGRQRPSSPGSNSLFPSAHTRHGIWELRRPGKVLGTSTCHRGHGAAARRPDVAGATAGQGRGLPLPPLLGTLASPAGRAAAPRGRAATSAPHPGHQLPGGSAPFREPRCARPPTSRHGSCRRAHVGGESSRAGKGGKTGLRGAGPTG